jgi:hypothetical protein
LGVQTPPPPKFRSFDKAEPNSQFRGIYTSNNVIRMRVSFICKLSGTPDKGLPPPALRSVCPLSSTEFFSGFGGLGVSILAFGTQDRGFAPDRSRRIFLKIHSMPFFGREVKNVPALGHEKKPSSLRILRNCWPNFIVPSFASRVRCVSADTQCL